MAKKRNQKNQAQQTVLAQFAQPSEAVQGLGDQLDVVRCPKCRSPLLARMTKEGPAMICSCSHPNEFHVGRGKLFNVGIETPSPSVIVQTMEEAERIRLEREMKRLQANEWRWGLTEG